MVRETLVQLGVVDWRRLPLGLLFHIAPILLAGSVLAAVRLSSYYVIILIPIFVAIIPALLSAWIATWVKWREPRVAGVVGFVLGVLAYLSQFYVWMVYWNGPAALWWFDVVPLVIIDFMNNMMIGDEGVNVSMNWAVLTVETATFGGAFALAHVEASKNLYCPLCSAPLKKKSSILPPDFATALAVGIEKHLLEDLPYDESGGEIEGDAWSTVEVLYCFHPRRGAEPLFFMTLRETRFHQGVGAQFVVIDKILLSADEMVLIGEKCPGLVVGPTTQVASDAGGEATKE